MWIKILYNPMRFKQIEVAFCAKAVATRGLVNRDGTCKVYLDTMLTVSQTRAILNANNIKFISIHEEIRDRSVR